MPSLRFPYTLHSELSRKSPAMVLIKNQLTFMVNKVIHVHGCHAASH